MKAALLVLVLLAAAGDFPKTSAVVTAPASVGGGSSAASLVLGTPQRGVGQLSRQAPIRRGVPLSLPPLPAATPTGGVGTVLLAGNASYAVPGLGPDYLAVRLPRGTGVTVCPRPRVPGRCWTTVTTDFGPSAAIEPPRVADIALGHWTVICDRPAGIGLCPVTIETLPALPATDAE